MGSVVADQIEHVVGFARDNFDNAVCLDAMGDIQYFAVNFYSERSLCQSRPDRRC